jgi:hypothetical protein
MVPILWVKKPTAFGFFTLTVGPIGCPETSVRNYHYSLLNNPEESSYNVMVCIEHHVILTCQYRMLPFVWGACGVLMGKPEGKRTMGRHRCRWEDNIKMDLQEVVGCGGNWMELAQDRGRWRALVSTVRNLRVPKMRRIS